MKTTLMMRAHGDCNGKRLRKSMRATPETAKLDRAAQLARAVGSIQRCARSAKQVSNELHRLSKEMKERQTTLRNSTDRIRGIINDAWGRSLQLHGIIRKMRSELGEERAIAANHASRTRQTIPQGLVV